MGPNQNQESRRLFASSPRHQDPRNQRGLLDEDLRRDMEQHPEEQPQQQQQQQGHAEGADIEIIHEVEVRIWKMFAGNVAGNKHQVVFWV